MHDRYRQSDYNIEFELDSGEVVLYNTKTGAVAVLNGSEKLAVLNALHHPDEPHNQTQWSDTLIEQGFLVNETKDELADILEWHHDYISYRGLLHLTLLPAEGCNFACPYCFQYKHRPKLMTPQVYQSILELIKRSSCGHEGELQVRVAWFGGEPTLAADDIISFLNQLNAIAPSCGISIRSDMVTNGYTLDADLLCRLVASGIAHYQVTLDGDRENHDRYRRLKDGSPTFDTIYSNLEAASALPPDVEFRMTVRGNFLRDSVPSMRRLSAMFQESFGHDERFDIYFRPVYEYDTDHRGIEGVRQSLCTLAEGIAWQSELAVDSASASGRATYGMERDLLPTPTFSWCTADRHHTYVIGADGALYVCDTLVGDDAVTIGRLTPDGQIALEDHSGYKETVFEQASGEACRSCKVLPLCMGGCRRQRLAGRQACFWSERQLKLQIEQYLRANEQLS